MTEHTTTETTIDANATQAAIGELRHLHPNDLELRLSARRPRKGEFSPIGVS